MKKLFICLFAILCSFCHLVLFFIPAPFFAISAIFLSHFWLFFSFPPSFLSFPRKPSRCYPRKHTQCHPWSTLTFIPNLIGDPGFFYSSLILKEGNIPWIPHQVRNDKKYFLDSRNRFEWPPLLSSKSFIEDRVTCHPQIDWGSSVYFFSSF